MKFGIRIPLNAFSAEQTDNTKRILNDFGGLSEMLKAYAKEFYSVEIVQPFPSDDPEFIYSVAATCADFGLKVTFHGTLGGAETPEDFFKPYKTLLEKRPEELINVTVHPFAERDKTADCLKKICDCIDKNGYNLRITLENQRYRDESTAGWGCAAVTDTAKAVNSKNLALCFDFGHQLSNIRKGLSPEDITDDEFFSRVKHTHIHSLFKGRTHFPLSVGETLLEHNITKLIKHGFDGVLMLELAPDRYFDVFEIKTSAMRSIAVLKAAVAQIEAKLAEEKRYETYGENISEAAQRLKDTKCGLAAIAPAGYLLKLGDAIIAVDPAVNRLPVSEEDKSVAAELVSSCDAIVITHAHGDHFDSKFLNTVSKEVPIYLPDFISFERENVISVTDGSKISVNDTEICFFDSPHTSETSIVLEYGFVVKHEEKSYIFPTDVRDYSAIPKVFDNTEVVVAHLWLGRGNALKNDGEYANEFCKYFGDFGAKRYLIGHLLDTSRTIEDMWSEMHCDMVKDGLKNPEMIKVGEFIKL